MKSSYKQFRLVIALLSSRTWVSTIWLLHNILNMISNLWSKMGVQTPHIFLHFTVSTKEGKARVCSLFKEHSLDNFTYSLLERVYSHVHGNCKRSWQNPKFYCWGRWGEYIQETSNTVSCNFLSSIVYVPLSFLILVNMSIFEILGGP